MSGRLKYFSSAFVLGLLLGLTAGGLMGIPWQKILQNVGAGTINGSGMAADYNINTVYEGYLGIYKERLAIYEGELPPNGILQHVMQDYQVRNDIRSLLEKGMPFTDTYDLLRLLENCTT